MKILFSALTGRVRQINPESRALLPPPYPYTHGPPGGSALERSRMRYCGQVSMTQNCRICSVLPLKISPKAVPAHSCWCLLVFEILSLSLARQFRRNVQKACSPFQFCPFPRAGVDCVGHAVRVAVLDDRQDWACDHVQLGAMFEQAPRNSSFQRLLPPVLAAHVQYTCCKWKDCDGMGEQADP